MSLSVAYMAFISYMVCIASMAWTTTTLQVCAKFQIKSKFEIIERIEFVMYLYQKRKKSQLRYHFLVAIANYTKAESVFLHIRSLNRRPYKLLRLLKGTQKIRRKKVMIPRAKRIRNAAERTKVTHATPSFTTIDIDTLLTNAICCVVCFSIALTILICWTFYYIDIHGGWRRSNCWITQFMHFISGDSIIVCGVTLCALRIIWHARGSVQDFFWKLTNDLFM